MPSIHKILAITALSLAAVALRGLCGPGESCS